MVSCSLLLYVISLNVRNYQVIASENLLIIANYFHITESFASFAMCFPLEPLPTSCRHHAIFLTHVLQSKNLCNRALLGALLCYVPPDKRLKVIAGVGTGIPESVVWCSFLVSICRKYSSRSLTTQHVTLADPGPFWVYE